MQNKKRFKIGARVNGFTFDNKRCFGVYRGVRPSFGVWIFGILEGSFEPAALHVCQSLTLESPPEPKIKRVVGRPAKFKYKDEVKGLSTKGERCAGFYSDAKSPFAWIKGWLEGQSRFDPPTSIKVIFKSLVSNAKQAN